MLGYMDPFSSIASSPQDAFVLFDNVRVEDLSAAVLQPPLIIAQPQNQSVSQGNVVFTVGASGSNPLTYQWRFGGANIAAATTSALLLTNVQSSNAGFYDVVVSNEAGLATSDAASLSLNIPVQFESVSVLSNGALQLLFSGAYGQDYVIEASTNLASWVPIGGITGTNGPLPFVDPDFTSFARRFYRAHSTPSQ
jgi:hypothetical protein